MTDRVFIIGAGKVGRTLTRAFHAADVPVALHARRPTEDATSNGPYPPALSDANVILIAVRDPDIDPVCQSLAALERTHLGRIAHGTAILHTSGTAAPPTFATLQTLGFPTGTFHPLIPFATPAHTVPLLKGAWVGIEGDPTACAAGRRLAAAIGARTLNIPSTQKPLYHAAAVFASNFPIVLATTATRLLTKTGVPEHTATQVVQSLMHAAVSNLDQGLPAEILTGPAARNDTKTIESHQHALRTDPEALALYTVLTQAARSLQ